MSNFQEMGETREPMAADCVQDALRIANLYEHVGKDFWILFASKAHQQHKNAFVNGWEVVWSRPQIPIPGILVWHVSQKTKQMTIDSKLSLPYDIPLDRVKLSEKSEDLCPELAQTAQKSGSILLA
jgi:hypothetical protein